MEKYYKCLHCGSDFVYVADQHEEDRGIVTKYVCPECGDVRNILKLNAPIREVTVRGIVK